MQEGHGVVDQFGQAGCAGGPAFGRPTTSRRDRSSRTAGASITPRTHSPTSSRPPLTPAPAPTAPRGWAAQHRRGWSVDPAARRHHGDPLTRGRRNRLSVASAAVHLVSDWVGEPHSSHPTPGRRATRIAPAIAPDARSWCAGGPAGRRSPPGHVHPRHGVEREAAWRARSGARASAPMTT